MDIEVNILDRILSHNIGLEDNIPVRIPSRSSASVELEDYKEEVLLRRDHDITLAGQLPIEFLWEPSGG